MWEKALELASHITHPWTIAVFVSVIAAIIFIWALRAKKTILPRAVLIILAAGIVALGLAPLAADTYQKSRGIYHVRVTVLGTDHSPNNDAHVTSTAGGDPKKVEGGWEFDIAPQAKPANGKLVLLATEKNAFLTGSTTLTLADDYYPTATIQLTTDASATIRGVVLDERAHSVSGAHVSVLGYPAVVTDETGNFSLPAHAAEGQIVQLRAEKDSLSATDSAPAGNTPVTLILKRH
jgi:hypothetical protein